jgi:hypothetical protein
MSNDEDKEKHSKRLHNDETALKRQLKIAKAFKLPVKIPHKLVKHHALNCGNPDCVMCMNPRKAFGEKTIQEQKFDQKKLHED